MRPAQHRAHAYPRTGKIALGQPADERRDFFLFIDEFHNFTTEAFAAILSEARKYRLCLSLSHQYIEQLKNERGLFDEERQRYVEKLMSFGRKLGELETQVLQLGVPPSSLPNGAERISEAEIKRGKL
jgi:TraM recognition site of TraD and TraG